MHGKSVNSSCTKKLPSIFTIIAILLLFSVAANAQQIFISLEPIGKAGTMGLYVLETAEYNLLVINGTNEKIENLDVYLTADNGLAFLVDGKENSSQRVTFSSVPANGRQFKGIKVKATGTSFTEQKIRAEYKLSDSTSFNFTTDVSVLPSPLSVDARIEKTSLSLKEENTIFLDLKNTSQSDIGPINAQLSVPENFIVSSGSLSIDSMQAGQSVQGTQFRFSAPEGLPGKAPIKLIISYEDDIGIHYLEKEFSVDVGDRSGLILLLIAAIVVLVAISLYMKFKGRKSN